MSRPTIKIGSRGEDVRQLQRILNLVDDGIFGELTKEAVIVFQKAHNLTPDGIVGKLTWAELEKVKPATPTVTSNIVAGCEVRKSKRAINLIVVHSTATQEGKDYSVDWLRKLHKSKGYSDIGYHYVIYRDGTLHPGRNVDKQGAHAKGHNYGSIGIVYIGGVDAQGKAKDTRTEAQKATLIALLKQLRKYYPQASIKGHRDVNSTACPSFDAKNEDKNI